MCTHKKFKLSYLIGLRSEDPLNGVKTRRTLSNRRPVEKVGLIPPQLATQPLRLQLTSVSEAAAHLSLWGCNSPQPLRLQLTSASEASAHLSLWGCSSLQPLRLQLTSASSILLKGIDIEAVWKMTQFCEQFLLLKTLNNLYLHFMSIQTCEKTQPSSKDETYIQFWWHWPFH